MNKNSFLQSELAVVRELAEKVAAFATNEDNKKIIKRWQDVNELRKPDRAPVWCRPVACWDELLPKDTLICKNELLQKLEYNFRQILIKRDINDDTPIRKYFPVQTQYDVVPSNRWGVDIGKHMPNSKEGAWAYDPPLKTSDDFDKLVTPRFEYNDGRTAKLLELYTFILSDIISVKLVFDPGYDNATIGSAAAELRGLEQIMMDMAVNPELMHRMMGYLRDTKLKYLDTIEQDIHLTPNTDDAMLCSEHMGALHNGKYTLRNCWCAGNSQEFDQVSPSMWEEFCLNYQKPIFERFGRTCYGCCENLTRKIDGVLSIPNLRIFVCSAWTNLDIVLNKINNNYCIMWRQKASDVVFAETSQKLREQIERGLCKLQGQYYQIVLRELQTLAGNMDRLHIWSDIAKELATKYA
ncbi:MAG: hypothetical protein ACYC54_13875 [Sedimentisphaerales bacterium]